MCLTYSVAFMKYCYLRGGGGEGKLNYKVVAMGKKSKRHIMGFLTSSVTIFGHVRSINSSIKFY